MLPSLHAHCMEQYNEDLPTRQGLILAAVAGCVDAISYEHYHVFTANMTGNTVLLAIMLGAGHWAQARVSLCLIFLFIVGSTLGRALTLRLGMRSALITETALLGIVTVVFGYAPAPYLAALAMGLQNASISSFRGIKINTSFITGNYGRVGRAIADMVVSGSEADQARREFTPIALFLTAYITGAICGGLVIHLSVYAMILPTLAIASVAIVWRRTRPSTTE